MNAVLQSDCDISYDLMRRNQHHLSKSSRCHWHLEGVLLHHTGGATYERNDRTIQVVRTSRDLTYAHAVVNQGKANLPARTHQKKNYKKFVLSQKQTNRTIVINMTFSV